MPHLKLPSGVEMFYSIPTCTDESAAFKKPYIDPARPTLLLIHGGACDSRSFQQQIQDPVVNQNFNLVCIDLPFMGLTRTPFDWKPGQQLIPPGHGSGTPSACLPIERQSEDVFALVKTLDLQNVHLVAVGVHTMIVYHLILNHSEMWKSAVLISPTNLVETQKNKDQLVDMWRAFTVYDETDLSDVWQGAYLALFGPSGIGNVEHRDEWIKIWKSYFFPAESKAWTFSQWSLCTLTRIELSDETMRKGFKIPICVISGTEHVLHPLAHAHIESILKTSSVCPFYESHHVGDAPTMAQITHSKEVNRILCKWVARCEGRRHSVYDAQVMGYNKHWDIPYAYLEERQTEAEALKFANLAEKRGSITIVHPE